MSSSSDVLRFSSALDQRAIKYYRFLRIPAKLTKISRALYTVLLLIVLMVYILQYILDIIDWGVLLRTALIHITALLILPLFLKILISYIKIRQSISMALFLIAPGIPLEVIGACTGLQGLGYIVVPIIGIPSIRSFTSSKIKSYLVVLYVLLIELAFTLLINLPAMSKTLIRMALTLLTTFTSICFTESLAYKGDINIYKIASSWIKVMMLNDDEEFSKLMDSMGVETEVNTYVLMFNAKTKNIAILVPGIHFGPFRNVGSASLPHIIDKLFKEVNIESFVLHGAGSHERDLVSFSESLRYAQNILEKILKKEGFVEEMLNEPFRVYNGFFESYVFQTNNEIIMIISTPLMGNDDIPYQVQMKAEEIGKIYGFDKVAIVDAHNVAGSSITEVDRYKDVIMASMSKSSRVCEDLGIGYGEAAVKGYVSGLCNNKIKSLAIRCNGRLYGLLYIYGNNAKAGLREALRKIAIDIGYTDIEVVTADDHSCSATSYDSPYLVVEPNYYLYRAVETSLAMSKNSIEGCRTLTTKITTRNKVVGAKIWELLELAKVVSHKILRYIATSFLAIYIISIALIVLLC